jgi:short-subunit dehydrogenase
MDEAVRLLEVNVAGLMRVTRRCLPGIVEAAGMIINIASSNVRAPQVNQAVYTASKCAVQGFADAVRLELRGRVCMMLPGPVNTWGAGSENGLLLRPGDVAGSSRTWSSWTRGSRSATWRLPMRSTTADGQRHRDRRR